LLIRSLLLAAFLVGPAAMAQAQSLEVTGGLALTSNYVWRGTTLSDDKPAFQAYVEAEASGAYAGLWISTMDDGTDTVEADIYLGYRNELANGFNYDLGYIRYIFNNSGNCCGEFALSVGYALSDTANLRAKLAYDPSFKINILEVAGDYALSDAFGLSATLGKVQSGSAYGDFGVTYALSEKTAFDLRYHDANDNKGRLVLGLMFDTTILSR